MAASSLASRWAVTWAVVYCCHTRKAVNPINMPKTPLRGLKIRPPPTLEELRRFSGTRRFTKISPVRASSTDTETTNTPTMARVMAPPALYRPYACKHRSPNRVARARLAYQRYTPSRRRVPVLSVPHCFSHCLLNPLVSFAPVRLKALPPLAFALSCELRQFLLGVLQPLLDFVFDLVPDLSESIEHLGFRNILSPRIIECPNQPRADAGKGLGAILLGASAHDDRVVEPHLAHVGSQALRVLVLVVDADLVHDFDCVGVNLADGVAPCAVYLKALPR